MQISPVQTRTIIFRRVHVEPALKDDGEIDSALKGPGFDWTDVKVSVQTEIGIQEEGGTEFMASLRVTVSNEEGRKCPYTLDVQLAALLHVSEKLPGDRREDLATVNGLAIVYGAMRELVVNLTSRMEHGPLVLPGVNFQDQAKMSEGARSK